MSRGLSTENSHPAAVIPERGERTRALPIQGRLKIREFCTLDLWRPLARVVIDFPAHALRIRACRRVVLRLKSVHRMSRPSERMMCLGHERWRHRGAKNTQEAAKHP
jgi:hypothetical protein